MSAMTSTILTRVAQDTFITFIFFAFRVLLFPLFRIVFFVCVFGVFVFVTFVVMFTVNVKLCIFSTFYTLGFSSWFFNWFFCFCSLGSRLFDRNILQYATNMRSLAHNCHDVRSNYLQTKLNFRFANWKWANGVFQTFMAKIVVLVS